MKKVKTELISTLSEKALEAPANIYKEWLEEVAVSTDLASLTSELRRAIKSRWDIGAIQFPLTKQLYKICDPDPNLYLFLQRITEFSDLATTEERDEKFLIEANFFFPTNKYALLSKLQILIGFGFKPQFVLASLEQLLQSYPDILASTAFSEADLKGQLSEDGKLSRQFAYWVSGEIDEIEKDAGLSFLDNLVLK